MKMTDIKKAWQRADRLKRAGISNKALRAYEKSIDKINKSDMSKKEKSAAKAKTARKFLAAQESTKTGIKDQKAVIDKYREPTPGRAEKRPMTAVKKAWQRAKRLEDAGIVNDALAKYNQDKAKIEKSKLSRAEKNKLKQAVAEEFLKQTTSTKTGIKESFEAAATGKAKDALKTAKEKADYVDAAETSRAYLTARALGLSSDQVRYALDMLDDMELEGDQRADAFKQMMDDISDFLFDNDRLEPDDITRFIDNWGVQNE